MSFSVIKKIEKEKKEDHIILEIKKKMKIKIHVASSWIGDH